MQFDEKSNLSPEQRIALGPDERFDSHPDSIARKALAVRVREQVLQVPYLEAPDVVAKTGLADVEGAVSQGDLLAYEDHGDLLFPSFQFDESTQLPIPVVAEINKILDAPHDGWAVTGWWTQPNGRLEGAVPPVQVLGNIALEHNLVEIVSYQD